MILQRVLYNVHCVKVLYAVGYERAVDFEMRIDGHDACISSLSLYNKMTGEITSFCDRNNSCNRYIRSGRCFGVGIAFPTMYTDEEGHSELWVGFHRNIVQIKRILPLLI